MNLKQRLAALMQQRQALTDEIEAAQAELDAGASEDAARKAADLLEQARIMLDDDRRQRLEEERDALREERARVEEQLDVDRAHLAEAESEMERIVKERHRLMNEWGGARSGVPDGLIRARRKQHLRIRGFRQSIREGEARLGAIDARLAELGDDG